MSKRNKPLVQLINRFNIPLAGQKILIQQQLTREKVNSYEFSPTLQSSNVPVSESNFHPRVKSSNNVLLAYKLIPIVPSKIPPQSFLERTSQNYLITIKSLFLPKGYPFSVTPDYLPFTLFQFIQSVSGTMAGTVSTQAMLHALGLGMGPALGLAATTNWIIKDGFGLLGGVIFAGFMGTRFDSSPKVTFFSFFYTSILKKTLEISILGSYFYSSFYFY
jgi:hypothetical protein